MNKFYDAKAQALTHSEICQHEKNNLKSLFQKYSQSSQGHFPLRKAQEQQWQSSEPWALTLCAVNIIIYTPRAKAKFLNSCHTLSKCQHTTLTATEQRCQTPLLFGEEGGKEGLIASKMNSCPPALKGTSQWLVSWPGESQACAQAK